MISVGTESEWLEAFGLTNSHPSVCLSLRLRYFEYSQATGPTSWLLWHLKVTDRFSCSAAARCVLCSIRGCHHMESCLCQRMGLSLGLWVIRAMCGDSPSVSTCCCQTPWLDASSDAVVLHSGWSHWDALSFQYVSLSASF